MRFDPQCVVELAEEVLDRDRERQLDDLRLRELVAQPAEQLIAYHCVAERDCIGVFESKALAVGEIGRG